MASEPQGMYLLIVIDCDCIFMIYIIRNANALFLVQIFLL